jgi:hypothetical protein
MLASACSTRHGRTSDGSAVQKDVHFNGWITTRVQDFACDDFYNGKVVHEGNIFQYA